MSDGALACVVDANVAIMLFFAQPLSARADALFARLAADAGARFYVPDFFYAECASALVNYVRLAKYPVARAKQDMTDLQTLALHVTPTTQLANDALHIAIMSRISGYDAFYIALSEMIGVPLVTADEKLVHAMTGKYDVYSLATFPFASAS